MSHSSLEVRFQRLRPDATLPSIMTAGAACYDLFSCEGISLTSAFCYKTVPTGIAVEIPPGYVGMVCSRSGLAAKHGVFVLNAPGIIDSDYRGELKVILARLPHNMMWPDSDSFVLPAGSRVAQLMVVRLADLATVEAATLSETERGAGGLGSTGI